MNELQLLNSGFFLILSGYYYLHGTSRKKFREISIFSSLARQSVDTMHRYAFDQLAIQDMLTATQVHYLVVQCTN